ncbi:MAG: dipeptide epimerase [Sedimentisphaerales bacterium]|nr:dipeptide epimerase [Sedimentisphaerales bacterium]
MVIKQIDIYKATIEYHITYKIALLQANHAKCIMIKITTDDGQYGWGEAHPFWAITGETQDMNLAGAKELAGLWIGKDPTAIEPRLHELQSYLVHNTTLHSAFDMALYDLNGKLAGLPLYRLLGGEKRIFETDNTVFMAEPQRMAETAREYVEQGFKAVKVKLGGDPQQDIHIISDIRKAVGNDICLRIDANQAWDFKTAFNMLKALEPYGIQLCEQPVPHWDHDSMKRLRSLTTIPIVADEAVCSPQDAFKLAAGGCCDYFNIKLSKSGGLCNAIRINAIAEAAGIACMVGCMSETRMGLAAAAHFVSARTNIRFIDLDGCFCHKTDPIIGGVTYDGPAMILPDAAGHGADVKPEFLAQCPCITVA